MKYMEKIRSMKKHKLISRILLLVILIYGLTFCGLFFSISFSLHKTLSSISIPDDYFLVSLVPSEPLLRVSYKIPNEGISEISDLKIDFEVSIQYFENYNNSERKEDIFFKSEKIKRINPWETYKGYIEGGSEYFNVSNILSFWNNANLSLPVFYILDIKITGKYCFGIIPFKIIIDNYNPECPSCV